VFSVTREDCTYNSTLFAMTCDRPATKVILIIAAALVFWGQAWAKSSRIGKFAPNVILVTIDTVRADHIGCYGAHDVQTPTLDTLANDGVVFDNAIAQVPLTLPSHAVILTGTYPFQNGLQDFTGKPLDKRFTTVTQVLRARGYATGAVVSAFVLDQSWGLARGFDSYDDAFSREAYSQRAEKAGMVERPAELSVTRALDWLNKTTRRPFFLWLHLYDPHSPYNPPEPYRGQYQTHPYDGEITYADHELGRLITWLKGNRLYDNTLILILSDHGESLGEHGEKEHGFFVYKPTVHVPLIIKPPSTTGIRPGRVSRTVETVAVASTLLHLAGPKDPVPSQFHLPDLLATGKQDESIAYSETLYPFNSFGWSPLHSLDTGHYRYIDAPEPELYELKTDPGETNNLVGEKQATVAVLKGKLEALLLQKRFTPSRAGSNPLAPDALEKLRALGYVGYRSPVPEGILAGKLADPKDKLWQFQAIIAAQDALHAGEFDRGESLLTQIQEKDPHLYIVPFYLGEAELAQEHWGEASNQFKKALDLNPNFEQAMTGLSRSLLYSGRLDEAKVWVDKVLRLNPKSFQAWYARAVIASRVDKHAAIAAYERAISLQVNFAPVHRDLGLLQFQQQNYPEAAKHLAKAVDLGTNNAVVYNALGISYSRTNQLRKAVESYKRALALDSTLTEAHVNLGAAYQRLNQAALARKEYTVACRLETRFCDLLQ
jgi:arylsulfatase A-like enzyme/Flp pilus assembly protein TadD